MGTPLTRGRRTKPLRAVLDERSKPLHAMFAEFEPLALLWESGKYSSEQSARWAIRTHRAALIDAGALAMDRGRLLVHPQRFAQVIERAAVDAVRRSAEIIDSAAIGVALRPTTY
jgi:hypothetical protein